MFIFRESRQLTAYVRHLQEEGKTVGFIPTMGALHQGHLSLIERARKEGDWTVCSIFVNPTQFDNKKDLELYPRTVEKDIDLLEDHECDIVFIPSYDEVYPGGQDQYQLDIDLSQFTSLLEGAHRPGHFEGMMQVVNRLLDIVPADRIYMGQKDYQQMTIVKHMLKKVNKKTRLVSVKIAREEDGLALSSRNVRIDKDLRRDATILHDTLLYCKENISSKSIQQLIAESTERIENSPFRLEYFSIVDGESLQEVSDIQKSDSLIALVAAWLGEVRLIDNMILKP